MFFAKEKISRGRATRGSYTFTGVYVKDQRKKNGVGGKPKGYIDAQGKQMNEMHDAWYENKFGANNA